MKVVSVTKGEDMPISKEIIEHILYKEVLYLPHGTQRKSIAEQVKYQLDERIRNGDKDLFFLTAFLDRATSAEEIQLFRKHNPRLKEILIKIANTHQQDINRIIQAYEESNMGKESAYDEFLSDNKDYFRKLLKVDDFRNIYETVPGRFWLAGLMVLFSVISKIYQNNGEIEIETKLRWDPKREGDGNDFLKNFTGENKIKGVADKLALWSLTNVNGNFFVIDTQIAKTLNKIGLEGFAVRKDSSFKFKKVEATWTTLFGRNIGNKNAEEWEYFKKDAFRDVLVKKYSFNLDDYKFLKFIITQMFWFYGRDRCFTFDVLPNAK